MVRALCVPIFVLGVACGGSPAPQPTQPAAPAPVASNQACECACECVAGEGASCECACACDGAEVATKLKVTRHLPPVIAGGGSDDTGGRPDDTVTATDWSGRVTKVDDLHYKITRAAIDEILDDPADSARGARIVPSIKDGKANGFKLYAIRPSSIFAALGIMNGDTLTAINTVPLTNPDQALEVYASLRDASRLDLAITRRGKDIVLVIEIE
jgi:hypothetical protein